MKILTVSNVALLEGTGSGYIVLGYARELRARGHVVDVIGAEDIIDLRRRRGLRYRLMWGMAVDIMRRVSLGYDVLQLYGGEAWLAIELLRMLPERDFLIVSHSNGVEPHVTEWFQPEQSWFQLDLGPLLGRALTKSDAVITVSAFDREYVVRRGYQPSARALGIDNPLSPEFLGLPPLQDSSSTIGYFGSWTAIKGRDIIAADVAAFLLRNPEWKFLAVGVGDSTTLRGWFDAPLHPRIEVIPYATREELVGLYRKCAITVAPSLFESFGLTIVEAMACGCAVITSPVGFAAAIQHREEAYILEAATTPHLYEALMAVSHDHELRARLARNGQSRVQGLTWQRAGSALEQTLTHWLAQLRAA